MKNWNKRDNAMPPANNAKKTKKTDWIFGLILKFNKIRDRMKRLENGRCKMKILNNKGLPVMQYEPWFSINSDYEFDERLSIYGVTPIMHYDPLGRLIQNDFPDGSTTRVEFDAWRQENWDQNDCLLDEDVDGNKICRWYTERMSISPTTTDPVLKAQRRAAVISEPHAGTPQILDLDVLGRVFQITDDNGAFGDSCVTHNKLDITGRILQVTDAKGRICTTNLFALGEEHLLKTHNIDSGARWMLNDTAGKPVRKWDSREHEFQFTYDALQRPLDTLLKIGNNQAIATQKIVYGTSALLNNIGQIVEIKAQDGKTSFEYDFKGNITKQTKQFAQDYENTLNWDAISSPVLLNETFVQQTSFDALNRPVVFTQPDNTTLHYGYDKGGLLNFVQRNDTDVHISNIEYNEKQQRLVVIYGNSTETTYTYHDQNFRLLNIYTQNTANDKVLQNLQYDYDKVGNIIKIEDAAQEVIYENNQEIKAESEYTYDALYRLLSTTGRERAGLGGSYIPGKYEDRPFFYTDPNSVRNYTHHFEYDALGNMLNNNGLINIYDNETNRLLGYDNNSTLFDYDAHGNMISMPGTENMIWNAKDELAEAKNSTETFHSYYRYDAQGNRTRKVTVKGNVREEYYYVDGYELYRRYTNGSSSEEYETVNISDDEKVFARIESRNNTSVIRYQYDNHLGSACLELNDGGDLISYEEYYAFGETAYFVQDSTISVSLKRYRYCGKEKDEETGLYYYGMRYYAAWLCRFVSVDPLQFEYPELSSYAYCANNPVKFIDSDGCKFGLVVEGNTKTVTMNVYTVNDRSYKQALSAARKWETKTAKVGDYDVGFKINVMAPVTVSKEEVLKAAGDKLYKKNGKIDKSKYAAYEKALAGYKASDLASKDNIGNVYLGTYTHASKEFVASSGESFNGGYADYNNGSVWMNSYRETWDSFDIKDLGDFEDLVAHEFGHLMGLDDVGGEFYSEDGIMKYVNLGFKLQPISDKDIENIIKHAEQNPNKVPIIPKDIE